MRNLYIIIFVFFIFNNVFSQTKTVKHELNIKQINSAKKIKDLIPELASECEIKTCTFLYILGGSLKQQAIFKGEVHLPSDLKNLEKIFIENIVSNCKDLANIKYIILPKKD